MESLFNQIVMWLRAWFNAQELPSTPPPPPPLVQRAELLRLLLAREIAQVYAGEEGKSAWDSATEGLEIGAQLGRGAAPIVDAAAGPGTGAIASALGATVGAIVGPLIALINKENLRARFDAFAERASPVERYLCAALLRSMVDKSRERERLPNMGPWQFVPSGAKTIAGPLSDFPGYFNVESLCIAPWPEPPPPLQGVKKQRDYRTQYQAYCLAFLGLTDNPSQALNHPGNPWPPRTAIWRQRIGGPENEPRANWLHDLWEARGGPNVGQCRDAAIALGMGDVVDAPLWDGLRPSIDSAIARRLAALPRRQST